MLHAPTSTAGTAATPEADPTALQARTRRSHLVGLGGAAALTLTAGRGVAEGAAAPGYDPSVIT
ncbi:MAG TPA: hypothetical protein VFN74_21270, partial [Chloroflexota bacterium]|nr:hypothetical protein [Chloroflexota bacterium]